MSSLPSTFIFSASWRSSSDGVPAFLSGSPRVASEKISSNVLLTPRCVSSCDRQKAVCKHWLATCNNRSKTLSNVAQGTKCGTQFYLTISYNYNPFHHNLKKYLRGSDQRFLQEMPTTIGKTLISGGGKGLQSETDGQKRWYNITSTDLKAFFGIFRVRVVVRRELPVEKLHDWEY